MHLRMSLPPDVKSLAATSDSEVFVDKDGIFVVLLIEGGCNNRHGFFRKFNSIELARAYLLGLQDAKQASDNLIFTCNPTGWFNGEKENA